MIWCVLGLVGGVGLSAFTVFQVRFLLSAYTHGGL